MKTIKKIYDVVNSFWFASAAYGAVGAYFLFTKEHQMLAGAGIGIGIYTFIIAAIKQINNGK